MRAQLGFTQQKLADELLLTRNYVAKIEAGLQEPSPRAMMALESLRVQLSNTAQPETSALEESAGEYKISPKLVGEINDHHAALLRAANNNSERLAWIREQQRAHLPIPEHWKKSGPLIRVTTPSQTQDLSSETGLPVPAPSRRARSA